MNNFSDLWKDLRSQSTQNKINEEQMSEDLLNEGAMKDIFIKLQEAVELAVNHEFEATYDGSSIKAGDLVVDLSKFDYDKLSAPFKYYDLEGIIYSDGTVACPGGQEAFDEYLAENLSEV